MVSARPHLGAPAGGACVRECAPRACVRPALGAHCSISAAGTATPPDWAIHHRRPRARDLHPAALRGAEYAPRARDSRPCAEELRVQVAAPRAALPTRNAATRATEIEAYF